VQVGEKAYVMRLIEHHPSRELTLDEVSDEIRELLVREEAGTLARQALEEAEQRLRSGEAAGVVARALDGSWQVVEAARRDQADLPRAVTQRAFELPRPGDRGRSIGTATIDDGDYALVTVTRIVEGDFDAMRSAERELLRQQLQRSYGTQDFEALFRTAREEARIRRRI
jgi:peptidyl-prolyl cis-trans isomerase D